MTHTVTCTHVKELTSKSGRPYYKVFFILGLDTFYALAFDKVDIERGDTIEVELRSDRYKNPVFFLKTKENQEQVEMHL